MGVNFIKIVDLIKVPKAVIIFLNVIFKPYYINIYPAIQISNFLPLRFIKAGRLWFGGARETH